MLCEDNVGMGVHSTYVVMDAQGFAQLCRTNGLTGRDIAALVVTRLIGLLVIPFCLPAGGLKPALPV